MNAKITPEELDCLRRLDTDAPQKPDLPPAMAKRLVEQGLAIELVEGGLQLTTLGREYLSGGDSGQVIAPEAPYGKRSVPGSGSG